ncbi:hypothetical protein SVAN01_01155 [Stagonosporopsis vannaccii]|nr:hypothetical protein SVAN01_01155 [Stagonosporopsis vannaccii]
MSQPDPSVADLLTMDLDSFTQAQLDTLFNTIDTDHTIYNVGDNNAFHDPVFESGFASSPTPPCSTVSSLEAIPDIKSYSFGQPCTDYSTPGSGTPYRHPIEQQQCFDHDITRSFPTDQPPEVLRLQTNTSYLAPSHPSPSYARRRSLSQGDMDFIATINSQAPNPTFMRLMTRRSRSAMRDSLSRKHQHSRSVSRTSPDPRREIKNSHPTRVPYFVKGLVSTPLGRPPSPEDPFFYRPAVQQRWRVQHGYNGGDNEDQVLFRHMTKPEQMERSHKIIEIGAMATNGALDPTLQRNGAAILKKLEEIEWYLETEGGGCGDALRGCVTIRKAVKVKMRMLGKDGR